MLLAEQRGECGICLQPALDPTVDHIVPASRRGGHHRGNMMAACRSCNVMKGKMTLHEWRNGCVRARVRWCHGEATILFAHDAGPVDEILFKLIMSDPDDAEPIVGWLNGGLHET